MAIGNDREPRRSVRLPWRARTGAVDETGDEGQAMPNAVTDSDTAGIRFLLDGKVMTVNAVPPTKSVLNFLREDLRRTGTKEGCAEGDCGACTVVIGEIQGDSVALKTVNACIQFVPALDGKALFTVEDLRQPNGDLHPVQQAMVDCHGSQCGFCTPGFVMSLWALYLEHEAGESRPTGPAIRSALTGNLCRCTGYRPILDAAERMFDLPRVPLRPGGPASAVALDRARHFARL